LKPDFTRNVELLLNDIKNKRRSKDEVIKLVKSEFLTLFDKFLNMKKNLAAKVNEIKNDSQKVTLMKADNRQLQMTTSKCPICKKSPMKLITPYQKRRFLACSDENCKSYVTVPKTGRLTILKSSFCSICKFNVFKITTRKNNKTYSYFLCPNCWSDGLKNKTSNGFCSSCSDYKIMNNRCEKR